MIKKLLLIFLVVLIAGGYWFATRFDSLIASAVRTYGPSITKTDIRLDGVSTSLFTGEAGINGLSIGNPKGFKKPWIMELGSMDVAVDTSTLTSQVIVINSIDIVSPKVTYEAGGGTNNVDALLANIRGSAQQAKQQKETGATAEEQTGATRRVIIDRVRITGGEASLAISELDGKGLTASLLDIELTDIGREGEPVTMAEAARRIMVALEKAVTTSITAPEIQEVLQGVGGALKDVGQGAEDVGKDAAQQIGDSVKGLFGN